MEPELEEKQVAPTYVVPNKLSYKHNTNRQSVVSMPHAIDLNTVDVQEVVVVSGESEELAGDYTYEIGGSAFQSGTEIAAEEEVTGEQKNRLEMMLAAVDMQEAAFNKKSPSKKVYFAKFRRQKRRWGNKVPSRIYKRQYLESDNNDSKDDPSYDDYMDKESYGRMMRREAKKRLFAHRLQWSNKNMESAMKDVQERNMTLRGAAKRNNVPYSTLKDRIQGRVVHGTKPGVKTVLSPEEESELVTCIQQLESGGFQLHCGDIRELARQMLMIRVSRGFSTPYRNGCPGHNWYAGFLKRHPGIQIKRLLNKNVALSTSKQKHLLKRFFDILSHTYKRMQVVHKPDNIFTVAELKISAYPHAVAILATSARGVALPPFIVLRGTAVDVTKPAVFYPPEFKDACFFNSRGRRDEDMMLYWFRDHFLRCMPYQRGRPVVLLVARPVATDISLRLVQLAADESVSLVCLPPGISHLVQPLSSNILRAIDASISMHVERLSAQGRLPSGNAMTPSSLALVLASAWNSEWPTADVSHAFSDCGVYPLNVRAITLERIASSAPDDLDASSDAHDHERNSDDEDDTSTDDAEHGLNLLSELSTMEQMQDAESLHQPTTLASSRRPVRQRADDSYYDSVYSKINHRRVEPKISEELMRRILDGPADSDNQAVGRNKTRPVSNSVSRRSDVHVEIAAARSNYDQINRAVDSIAPENSSSSGPAKRRPGRPRTSAFNRPDIYYYGQLPKHNSSRSVSGVRGGVKQEYVESDEKPNNTETSNSSMSWLETDAEAPELTAKEPKDVIEEVDLSDLYVNVEDGSARLADQVATSNDGGDLASGGGSSNSPVVHCDLRQLASQLQPDQKVDVIQNIVVGGRTMQIIRRLAFDDVVRMVQQQSDGLVQETVEVEEVVELAENEEIEAKASSEDNVP